MTNVEVRRGVARWSLELLAWSPMSFPTWKLHAQHVHEKNACELVRLISLRSEGQRAVERGAVLLGATVLHIARTVFVLT